MKQISLIIALLTLLAFGLAAQAKSLTMGYKDDNKLPFIGDKDDNSGAYQELFSQAAKSIGYDLKTVRAPKKRVLGDIESGAIDFWPGADFDQDRAKYMYFLENGFAFSDVAITLDTVPEITDFDNFSGTLLAELGSTKLEYAQIYPKIKISPINTTPLDKVVELLKMKRGDVYVEDSTVIEYYLKTKGLKDFKSLGLKAHYNAFGGQRPMYIGFSMKSPYFKGNPNPKFDKNQAVSIQNFPVIISQDCPAYQFYQALQTLKKSGATSKIYNKYFK